MTGAADRPQQIWNGQLARTPYHGKMLASDQDEWEALWRLTGVTSPRPLAEGNEIAIGIFLGVRQASGYIIQIRGLKRAGEDSDGIWTENRVAAPEQALPISSPWAIATFARGQEEIRLKHGL